MPAAFAALRSTAFLILAACAGPAWGGDYFVSPAGSDADGRTRDTAWKSLERAADAVPDGAITSAWPPGTTRWAARRS